MPVYTVHAPVANGADFAAADKFVFVRDGFHFWAAVATVIWLLWHRLWLVLIGWIVLMIPIQFGMSALGAEPRHHLCRQFPDCHSDGLRSGQPAGAGRCRGENGASSTSWSPTTRRRPSIGSSSAGPPGSAGWPTTSRAVDRGGPPPTRNFPGQPFSKPAAAAAARRDHRPVSGTGRAAMSVAIVDYGSGNLHSAAKAFELASRSMRKIRRRSW